MAAPRRECDPFQREETDLTSPNFNPLAALYSSRTSVPYPNVQLFNNLAEYESAMKARSEQPASMDATSSATVGRSLQTFEYGHGSGDGTYVTYDYGHGSSGGTSRVISSQAEGSASRVLDYGHRENRPVGVPSVGTPAGYLPVAGDYSRDDSIRDSSSSHHSAVPYATSSQYTESDPHRKSELDPCRQSDSDLYRKYSDRDTNPHKKYSDPDPYKKLDQIPDPHRKSDRVPDLHRLSDQDPDPHGISYRDPYKQTSAPPTRRHSNRSADGREQEYLDKQGFSDQDCEHFKISKRDRQSTAPPSQRFKEETKSEGVGKGDGAKLSTVLASVGGAKGAWSYDKVEKLVQPEEKPKERMEEELPDSFDVGYTQTADHIDEKRNVLNRMEEYSLSSSGPLHILYRCMKEKLQARVWTRSAVCVRGICKGYIVAFDKHSNLAMMDVDEFFRNPAMKGMKMKSKKKLAEKKPLECVELALPCEATWLGLRKEKLCVRHLNQVFIRGDNVVSISIVQNC